MIIAVSEFKQMNCNSAQLCISETLRLKSYAYLVKDMEDERSKQWIFTV